MFRLQDNVPEVYPDKSRDFQLFCRLFDVSFNSVKQSIDSLQYATDTLLCDSSILPLLKTKLGFFSDIELSDKELRYILHAFPTIMRYKGSAQAFVYVANLYSRLVGEADSIRVKHDRDEFRIEVTSEKGISRSQVLFELLDYILPAGYVLDYFLIKHHDSSVQLFTTNSIVYNPHLVEYSFQKASSELIGLDGSFTDYEYLIRGRISAISDNSVEIVDPQNAELYPKMIVSLADSSDMSELSNKLSVGDIVAFYGAIGRDGSNMLMRDATVLDNRLTVVVHSDIVNSSGTLIDESRELPRIINMAQIEGDT